MKPLKKEKHPLGSLQIPSGMPEDFSPTDPDGLTEAEAEARASRGLHNSAPKSPGKSVPQIIVEHVFTVFNLLNISLAALLAMVGAWRNMLFLGVVVSNTLIGVIQEIRAHRTIQRLSLLNAPMVTVLREGREREVRSEELVLGDLIVLRAGNQIPADAIVARGICSADESLLTGESDPVEKAAGDWLLSGSFLQEGTVVAQLIQVGADSYVSRLTSAAKKIHRPKSVLMSDLQRLVSIISAALVPIGGALLAKQYFFLRQPLTSAVPRAVAAMIGMIPEGLMLLTSVALAVGVVRLGRRNTLVQELYGIEMLARTDVLCLDKTGTITTGEMHLEQTIPLEATEAELREALARFLGASDTASPTMRALCEAVQLVPEVPVATVPFSSARKKAAITLPGGVTYVLGAPSFTLGEAYTGALQSRVEALSAQGLRVLTLAECDGSISDKQIPPIRRVLGLLALSDCLRPNAADTLRYFARQGVAIKVISGDDPRTVSMIAARAGLDGADRYVDVSLLRDDQLAGAVSDATVFGRVTPERKRALVLALKTAGHCVAMTGDGVNDIPALKAADCSIAMAGSDAARRAAQMTLLDADFSSLPAIVGEGRRVINNITRAASLFLIKTLYSFSLAVLSLLLPVAYPFLPIQLTLISSLTIGVPSTVLALEPSQERVRGRFLRTVLARALPGALGVTLCALVAMLMERQHWSMDLCSSMATMSAASIGMVSLAKVCMPLNRLRGALLAAMGAGLSLAILLFPRVFYLVHPTGGQLLVLLGLILAGVGLSLLVSRWVRARWPEDS